MWIRRVQQIHLVYDPQDHLWQTLRSLRHPEKTQMFPVCHPGEADKPQAVDEGSCDFDDRRGVERAALSFVDRHGISQDERELSLAVPSAIRAAHRAARPPGDVVLDPMPAPNSDGANSAVVADDGSDNGLAPICEAFRHRNVLSEDDRRIDGDFHERRSFVVCQEVDDLCRAELSVWHVVAGVDGHDLIGPEVPAQHLRVAGICICVVGDDEGAASGHVDVEQMPFIDHARAEHLFQQFLDRSDRL